MICYLDQADHTMLYGGDNGIRFKPKPQGVPI
jgi:hypothetical protein